MYFKKNLSIKKFLLFILFLLQTSIVSWSQTQTYSYTFNSPQFSDLETKNLVGVNWTLSGEYSNGTPTDFNYDGSNYNRGHQFGSGSKYFNVLTLTTNEIQGDISKVSIWAAKNTNGQGALHSVNVGEENFSTTNQQNLSHNVQLYEFIGESNGEIVIRLTANGTALYIKKIEVVYTTPPLYELSAE